MTVIDWLLDSDPSIRWQVMRDLTDAPGEQAAAERTRVSTEGAGAGLLALQADDGRWGGVAWNRGWNSTMHVLMLLRELGLDPLSDQARRAISLVRDRVTWQGCGPQECDGHAFFEGELEPCINGQVAMVGAYFGQDVQRIVDRLLVERDAVARWGLELRGAGTLYSVVVQHHDLCARGTAGVRTDWQRNTGSDRGEVSAMPSDAGRASVPIGLHLSINVYGAAMGCEDAARALELIPA